MPQILRFYWGLLKGTPGHVQATWERTLFWVVIAFGVLTFFNPEMAKAIKDSWDGVSRWWSILFLAVAVLFRLARENYFVVQNLRNGLTEINQSSPKADLRLIDENDVLYLEIHNSGATGDFRTQLKLTGTQNCPTKNLFSKWDHLMNGGATSSIAKGTTIRSCASILPL